MKLTKIQKLLAIIALANQMKELKIKPDLKPSEIMMVASVLVNELEDLPESEQEEITKEAYIQAVRNLYNDVFEVPCKSADNSNQLTVAINVNENAEKLKTEINELVNELKQL